MRRKSVVIGARWENIVTNQARRSGYGVIDVPDGCMVVGRNKLIRVPTPFDMMLFHSERKKSIFLDAKTTLQKKFPISLVNLKQVKELSVAASAGNPAGYLVFFESLGKVVWFRVEALIKANMIRKSIEPSLGIHLGSMNEFNLDLIV